MAKCQGRAIGLVAALKAALRTSSSDSFRPILGGILAGSPSAVLPSLPSKSPLGGVLRMVCTDSYRLLVMDFPVDIEESTLSEEEAFLLPRAFVQQVTALPVGHKGDDFRLSLSMESEGETLRADLHDPRGKAAQKIVWSVESPVGTLGAKDYPGVSQLWPERFQMNPEGSGVAWNARYLSELGVLPSWDEDGRLDRPKVRPPFEFVHQEGPLKPSVFRQGGHRVHYLLMPVRVS